MMIRQAAVAGLFYPHHPAELESYLEQQLPVVSNPHKQAPKALIVPHAGYRYSGATAARGYERLDPGQFQRVVIMGPAHRVPLSGIALPEAEAFATPLGTVALDQAALQALEQQPGIFRYQEAHHQEHCIEVQLPFLQHRLGQFTLIPLVVGDYPASALADLLDSLLDEHTLLVVSTDLSHYLNWNEAYAKDNQTVEHILHLQNDLDGYQACGCYALNGTLQWARRHELHAQLLAQCNSGDVTGDKDRVVGYAAIALY